MEEKYSDQELFDKLVAGEQITETIETSRGTFEIKYPLGIDFVEINKRKAILRGSVAPEMFNRAEDLDLEAYATLDQVVVTSPDWWKKLKSSIHCPDQKLITDLYRRYLRHYEKVQQSISTPGPDDGKGKTQDDDKVVGDGPFSGVTYRSQDKGTK